MIYRTPRLLLRHWRAEDRAPFAELNADPEVMRHFPKPLTRSESDASADHFEGLFKVKGYGPWAIEVPGVADFVGFVGLYPVDFEVAFSPPVEIMWRLSRSVWGQGYATEAAQEACRIAFEELHFAQLVSFAVPENARSRAVMARLGMTHEPSADFLHPKLPEGHPLRPHVFYRLSLENWVSHR